MRIPRKVRHRRRGAVLATLPARPLFPVRHDVAQQWPAAASNRPANDRRQQARVEQYFDCTWLSDWSEERSRVSSLSPTGCYIECRSAVPPEGTPLDAITVALPTGEITLQGTVVHAIRGVGFAVQFTKVDDDVHARLSALERGDGL